MDKSRLLWILVAADVLLAFGSAGAEAFFGWTLPTPLADHRDDQGVSAIRLLLLGITTVSAFTAWIGLVCFWRPAREIYLFAAACAVALALFPGRRCRRPSPPRSPC